MDTKSIITIFGTEKEKHEMWKLKNEKAGGSKLSFSDFILREFNIRKAPELEANS